MVVGLANGMADGLADGLDGEAVVSSQEQGLKLLPLAQGRLGANHLYPHFVEVQGVFVLM